MLFLNDGLCTYIFLLRNQFWTSRVSGLSGSRASLGLGWRCVSAKLITAQKTQSRCLWKAEGDMDLAQEPVP